MKKSHTIQFKGDERTVSMNKEVYLTRHLDNRLVYLKCERIHNA